MKDKCNGCISMYNGKCIEDICLDKPRKERLMKKIESGVPIPDAKRVAQYSYVEHMKVNDSVFYPNDEIHSRYKSVENIRNGVRMHCKLKGLSYKFTTRMLDDGLRIWRII